MANIRKVLREKFGFTTNLPDIKDMHDGPAEKTGRHGKGAAFQSVEKYREVIKTLMGHKTTEKAGKIEDIVDFAALTRLANKHGLAQNVMVPLGVIEVEIGKKGKLDRKAVIQAWTEVQKHIPFWFLGLLPHKEEMPEEDKKNLTNLLDLMDKINKNSEKEGKAAAKDTEHAGRDTAAKKNLDKARKEHKIDTDAASEKKLKKEPKKDK